MLICRCNQLQIKSTRLARGVLSVAAMRTRNLRDTDTVCHTLARFCATGGVKSRPIAARRHRRPTARRVLSRAQFLFLHCAPVCWAAIRFLLRSSVCDTNSSHSLSLDRRHHSPAPNFLSKCCHRHTVQLHSLPIRVAGRHRLGANRFVAIHFHSPLEPPKLVHGFESGLPNTQPQHARTA